MIFKSLQIIYIKLGNGKKVREGVKYFFESRIFFLPPPPLFSTPTFDGIFNSPSSILAPPHEKSNIMEIQQKAYLPLSPYVCTTYAYSGYLSLLCRYGAWSTEEKLLRRRRKLQAAVRDRDQRRTLLAAGKIVTGNRYERRESASGRRRRLAQGRIVIDQRRYPRRQRRQDMNFFKLYCCFSEWILVWLLFSMSVIMGRLYRSFADTHYLS